MEERKKLFWKLSAFGKFDLKRFGKDAERLKLIQSKPAQQNETTNNSTLSASVKTLPETAQVDDQKSTKKKKKKGKITASKKRALLEEEIRHLRNVHHIHIQGSDIPDPLKDFAELKTSYGVKDVILTNIESQGYTEPTGVQRQAIPIMIQGRDLMACAPTGCGKTAAFIIPILHHLKEPQNNGFRALVLAPTRELAKQIVREFRKLSKGLGLRSCYIEKESTAIKKSNQNFDILVSTPNRLVYLLQQNPPLLDVRNVEWLVVDESDKLFEAGTRGFRDQLGAIYKACSSSKLHRAMFSATFAQDVEEWCKLNLDNVVQVTIGAKNTAINTVEQKLLFTGDESGKLIAIRNLIREGISPPVLVFVQSKERAKHLYTELMYDNINIDVIHADRPQEQRDKVVKNFRLGHIWFLICTELMGRGIDFKGVNLVINYDFPTTAISYIHRIGRTGRAGRTGKAITFFTENDKPNLRSIANMIRQAGCPVPDYMIAIKKPGRKEKRRLANHVPERQQILTMDPRDYERLQRKRKFRHQKQKSLKKPRLGQSDADQSQTGNLKNTEK
uniref:Probable ATP-dependent RNA helicase DDX52 n=1 Tax=Biomphalaria glabrata TaxID=6526 RepID=A0A2C9K6E6_BIOGL